jgi:AraC family transcriptional regulator, regulatory protein of adaptative response / methylated-DNA-[protein]-cysteine methyltransferase
MATQKNRLSDARRWRAVLNHDRQADTKFVYAVRSTGVYCRPSCPSRRPRRDQVAFFRLPRVAERAGFRPCRRCRPEIARDKALDSPRELVARLCRAIGQNPDETPNLATLASQLGMSSHGLHRVFRRVLGITPKQFADALRLRRLKGTLRRGMDVTTALYDAGYGSASRLYEGSNAKLGMTPATYRQGGAGMEMTYTIADCSLGRVLVATTSRGVSAVYLGDRDRPLERALREEYPRAKIHRGSGALGPWLRAILRHLQGAEKTLDLPLDVAATAFQRRVWEELQKIPYGATRSYSQVAVAIGRPASVRAVARACATNPVSIVVPCHRVVRKNGDLSGYRWGLSRKKALLEKERGGAAQMSFARNSVTNSD